MSARNMVRNLRDSGSLETQAPAPAWRFGVLSFVGASAFGAVVYLAGVYGLPVLNKAMEKPAPVVSFAKP